MANRRMFSKEIIGSDSFLDLPVSSRELYFQLGMYADDDGFVSPKKVIRMVGSSDDDLKILLAKEYVLPFKSGVIVITHWKDNNYLRSDRYTPTVHQDELKLAQTDMVYQRYTQYRIGKDSKEEDRGLSSKKKPTYRGMSMRKQGNKWFCLPLEGGQWLEFAAPESEIEWKTI